MSLNTLSLPPSSWALTIPPESAPENISSPPATVLSSEGKTFDPFLECVFTNDSANKRPREDDEESPRVSKKARPLSDLELQIAQVQRVLNEKQKGNLKRVSEEFHESQIDLFARFVNKNPEECTLLNAVASLSIVFKFWNDADRNYASEVKNIYINSGFTLSLKQQNRIECSFLEKIDWTVITLKKVPSQLRAETDS